MKIFFVLLWPMLAQALEIKSFVDKTEVGLNETFVLNVQFESKAALPQQVSVPDLSRLKGFYFLDESSSQRSSIQIINGQMSKTNTLLKVYRFQPKAIGFFKIPSLTIQAAGKSFQTQPIAIKVVKNRLAKPSPAPQPAPSPFNIPDPFNFPNTIFKNLPNLLPDQDKDTAFLKLELSKSSVYKSEILKADWFLLSSSSNTHFNLFRMPELKGFWKEKLKNPSSFVGAEIVDKTLYRKQLIDSLWLFPLKSNQLELDPYSVRLSSFFRGGSIVSTPVKTIKVKNLPAKGLDKTWTGAVGDFSVKYLIKEKLGVVNEPLSLKIIFEGLGHPRFITLPSISFPSSVSSYPPVQKSQFSDKGIGTKEFEILIIPKEEGQLIIPSFSLSTFNTQTGQYISHKSPEFLIAIQKGQSNGNLDESFLDTEGETEVNVLNRAALEDSYWPFFIKYKNLIWFFTALFCFFVFSLAVIFIKKIILKRKKTLKKKVSDRFLTIQKLLDKKDWKKACIEMIQLGTYVLSLSQIQETAVDWRQSLQVLTPSLNEKYSTEFEILFKKLESLSFSAHLQSSDLALKQSKQLFHQSKILINKFLTHL